MNNIANLFDRKKTKYEENIRFNNIHKKSKQYLNVNVNKLQQPELKEHEETSHEIREDEEKQYNIKNYKNHHENYNTIYTFHNFKNIDKINMRTIRENKVNKINKIQLKNIIIPTYSDNDTLELTGNAINQNISKFIDMDKNIENKKDEIIIPHYSNTDIYDLNINKNISQILDMDIFIKDIFSYGDINILKKKKVNKIYHIYQEKYALGISTTGFGDFIRSCFFIIQFCKLNTFNCEIIINHPIAYFLNKFKHFNENNIETKILNQKISMFSENNWNYCIFDEHNYIQEYSISETQLNKFIDYLCQLKVINNSIFSYNIFFPYNDITNEECIQIKSLLEPNEELQIYIIDTLNKLEFVKNHYNVIHIRTGDSYLINGKNKFDDLYIENIKDEINNIIYENKNTNFLIISDNNDIKYLLRDIYFKYNFKFLFNDITHVGEGVLLKRDNIKNTLLDFYLMSYSSYIYSITTYEHGSGFSYWCSQVYSIPHKCKYIALVN
jgi:hypothetical protein